VIFFRHGCHQGQAFQQVKCSNKCANAGKNNKKAGCWGQISNLLEKDLLKINDFVNSQTVELS
jgi:hypothetical protein